jgi:hypothetical protein
VLGLKDFMRRQDKPREKMGEKEREGISDEIKLSGWDKELTMISFFFFLFSFFFSPALYLTSLPTFASLYLYFVSKTVHGR